MSYSSARTSFAFLMVVMPGIPFVPDASPCAADTPTFPPSTTAAVTLPAHTLVPVVAINHLKSGRSREGEEVIYKTFATVYGSHHEVLIPAGSEGHGKVTESEGCGMAGKGGKLKFTCDFVVAGNAHVSFCNADLSKQGKTYNAVTTLLMGGPLSLFSKGKDIDVDEGAPFIMDVAMDTSLLPVQDARVTALTIVLKKRHSRGYAASITSFNADTITVTTDKGESTVKLQDVKQIILTTEAASPLVAALLPPAAVAPPPPAASPQSVFTFKNGSQAVGTLLSFDGTAYAVRTPKGMRRFNFAAIKTIAALPNPAAAGR